MTWDGKERRLHLNIEEQQRKLDAKVDALYDLLHQVKVDVTKLNSHVLSEVGNHSRLINAHFDWLQKHEKEVYGEADYKGLKGRVQTIEDDEKIENEEKKLFIGGLLASIFGLIFKIIYDVFKRG